MRTSQTFGLSEPSGTDKISLGTLGYVRARNRQRAYDLVIREFKQSSLTQADLAKRLCKAPEVISRLLARPQNWESDTFSDLLFAITGGIANYGVTRQRSIQAGMNIQILPNKITTIGSAHGVPSIQSQPRATTEDAEKMENGIIHSVSTTGLAKDALIIVARAA